MSLHQSKCVELNVHFWPYGSIRCYALLLLIPLFRKEKRCELKLRVMRALAVRNLCVYKRKFFKSTFKWKNDF